MNTGKDGVTIKSHRKSQCEINTGPQDGVTIESRSKVSVRLTQGLRATMRFLTLRRLRSSRCEEASLMLSIPRGPEAADLRKRIKRIDHDVTPNIERSLYAVQPCGEASENKLDGTHIRVRH